MRCDGSAADFMMSGTKKGKNTAQYTVALREES